MDYVLDIADRSLLTPYVYPASWPEDGALRQVLSLLLLTNLGAELLYLGFAFLSFYYVFDHRLMKHPYFLENQVQREIKLGVTSIFWMSFPTVAFFFAEIRGYSKLYDNISDSSFGWPLVILSIAGFLFFTDTVIYWLHRILHHKSVYKYLHKQHHIFKVPTPFASHAFHPVDGFLQSLPYHVYPFLFPLHKINGHTMVGCAAFGCSNLSEKGYHMYGFPKDQERRKKWMAMVVYLVLFVFVNVWTISIHDGDFRIPWPLIEVINGAAHHVDHHLYFYFNYGQYFTLWDRLVGSYRHSSALQGKGPLDHVRKLSAAGKSRR